MVPSLWVGSSFQRVPMAAGPPPTPEPSLFTKLSYAFSNVYKKFTGSFEAQIRNGRSAMDMPVYPIMPLAKQVVGCNTGPYGGLCQLDPEKDHPTHDRETPVAGISNWYRPHPIADGDSITLYEHKPGNTQHHGDPIADVFSIVVRPNNCIMAVADGVNWGIKPRLAARCAVHGVVEHLNVSLFGDANRPRSVQDVFHCILRSFHSAQKLIIQHGGTTTTLCVGVIVELQEPKNGNGRWGLCVVSVGDTLCFVWRGEVQMVYEVTSAMHLGQDRNPRDCGGCLGCNLGDQPDLSNLLCCFVPLADDDIVFIVSDGISDNSDPVILKEALSEGQPISPTSAPTESKLPGGEDGGHQQHKAAGAAGGGANGASLPVINAEQRQGLTLMKITNILKNKLKAAKVVSLDAQDVRDAIINHVIEATEAKREYLERCWVELERPGLSVEDRRSNERKIAQHIKTMPGKLDHATIVAYKVGQFPKKSSQQGRMKKADSVDHPIRGGYTRKQENYGNASSRGHKGGGLFRADTPTSLQVNRVCRSQSMEVLYNLQQEKQKQAQLGGPTHLSPPSQSPLSSSVNFAFPPSDHSEESLQAGVGVKFSVEKR